MRIRAFYLLTCFGFVCTSCSAQQLKPKEVKLSGKIAFENISQEFFALNNQSEVQDTPVSVSIKLAYNADDEYIVKDNPELTREEQIGINKDYFTAQNKALADNIDFSEFSDVYISTYSPFISLQTEWQDIYSYQFMSLNNLAAYDEVEKITVLQQTAYIPCMEEAKDYVGLSKYVNETDNQGRGVVVGILEPGIANKDHSNFSKYHNMTVRDEWYFIETVAEHTTKVASIIGGINGIAPKCTMFSVQLWGDAISEMDWLLDHNVNVVNMSFGEGKPTGVYNTESAYMDYIAYRYKVTFVACAGNYGNDSKYVTNPGLGYNVITVGACDSYSPYARDFSSYITVKGPKKPNLVAPGANINITPFGTGNLGTSFSSAIVTGIVALMMYTHNDLKLHPELVCALLSSSSIKPDSDSYFGNGLNKYIGTGAVNYDNIRTNNNNWTIYPFTNAQNSFNTWAITAKTGQTVRVVLKWLAKANGNVNETTSSKYELVISTTDGIILNTEYSYDESIIILEIWAPYTATYPIDLSLKSTIDTGYEYLALSFYKF